MDHMEQKIRKLSSDSASNIKPFVQEVFGGKVCIGQNLKTFVAKKFRCFQPVILPYYPLCDDFGPMNLMSITQFVEQLCKEIETYPNHKIVYLVEPGRRALTNAAFLLGAYMILKCKMSTDEIVDAFGWLDASLAESYRDATHSQPDFLLTLEDCWRGLERSCNLGWAQDSSLPGTWGKIDIGEYDHYDNPLNGDLHSVVPDKFVAFRGPKELGDKFYRDDADGNRFFSPNYYIDVFKELGVTTVVRVNEPEYDKDAFVHSGIQHFDLEFQDCTSPPPHIVKSFFSIVDSAPGAIAIHCKAGLGRTGTLIALCLMRSYGFCAREAMGWLRIMRPGSVIGEQQHYLCAVEKASARRATQPCLAHLHRPSPHAHTHHVPEAAPHAHDAEPAKGGSAQPAAGAVHPRRRRESSTPPREVRGHRSGRGGDDGGGGDDIVDGEQGRGFDHGRGYDHGRGLDHRQRIEQSQQGIGIQVEHGREFPPLSRVPDQDAGGHGGGSGGGGGAAALAAQVAEGMERRSAARARASLSLGVRHGSHGGHGGHGGHGSHGSHGGGGPVHSTRCLLHLASASRKAAAAAAVE